MKEFDSQTGGRYTYVDDIINLQDLALAITAMFNDCDNFVLSGCEVSGSSISSGYVYINGKLRYFSGASGITTWPQYIYESNKTENVAYASGSDKVGRKVYGCAIGQAVPTTADPITGNVPESITVTSSGATTFKEAFIGKYAVLLNSGNSQSVAGSVSMGSINVQNVTASGSYKVSSNGNTGSLYYNGGNFVWQSTSNAGNEYKIVAEDGTGICLYANSNKVATFSNTGVSFGTGVQGNTAAFGSIAINDNNLYNSTAASDDGAICINVIGQGGGTGYYRDTHIGNGKSKTLFSVIGSTGMIKGYGSLELQCQASEGIVLSSPQAKTDNSLQKYIVWKDKNAEIMAFMGYNLGEDQVFRIGNFMSTIEIAGVGSVNIGPSIKENGQLLSDKYVQRSEMNGFIGGKADSANVYTKTESDSMYGKLDSGLSQFVSTSRPKETLCAEIGAATSASLSGYAKNSMYLADMATDDEAKQKIRQNIGAAGSGDFQSVLKDTGWIVCDGQPGLYARQIGNIVSIQGKITTVHSGQVFAISSKIDAPTYSVHKTIAMTNALSWTAKIDAGSRQCRTVYCNGSCGRTTEFSITYMV